MSVKIKSLKKKRQMTDEQKAAAAERLEKARQKRLANNPPAYKGIYPTVLELEDDDTLSMRNVKEWIKTQKEIAQTEHRNDRAGIKGALAKKIRAETYVRNMQNYLQNGTWLDMFYGEFGDKQMGLVCRVLAYDDQGEPKRCHGVFYPDINKIWGVDSRGEEE